MTYTRNRSRFLARRRLLAMVSLGPAAWLLTGCVGRENKDSPSSDASSDSPDFSARFARFEPADEPNGDLSRVIWPAFITEAGGDIQALYEFQVINGDIMRYMPCFCGCHLEDGHRNNRDCYIEQVNPDGSVVFDSMAPT